MQENRLKKLRLLVAAEAVLCLIAVAGIICNRSTVNLNETSLTKSSSDSIKWAREALSEGYIKWVDFNVSYEALCKAYEWDVNTYGEAVHVDWIEMLAYLGASYGGDFASHSKKLTKDMNKLVKKLTEEGCTMEELTADMKYYDYFEEAYRAVLGGMVGEYEIEKIDESGNKSWSKVYGLKAYSPIAKGFEYSHYDDFGSGRSYGYKRKHLGHDMMGQTGTPVNIISRIGISK